MENKRVLSLLLVFCMLASLMPGSAIAEEPICEESVYEEAPYEELAYDDESLYEETAYEELPSEEPAYENPPYEDTSNEEPINVEPANEGPAYEEPAYEEPANEEPSNEEPAYEEPAYEEPANEESGNEEPAYEEPANEKPANEEPPYEDDSNEEPANEEEIIADSVTGQTASLEAVFANEFGEPEILGQPNDVTADAGNTVSFHVWTDDVVNYNWEVRENNSSDWQDYTGYGCTDYEISLRAEYSMNGYQFRCMLSNDVAAVYTEVATLTVILYPPEIGCGPNDVTVTETDYAYFSVNAGGYELSYQWQERENEDSDWNKCSAEGNTTSELRVMGDLSLDGYQYRCMVTNPAGTVYSNEAILYVEPLVLIFDQSGGQEIFLGDSVDFWVVVSAQGNGPISYQWQVRKDAYSNWSNSGIASAKSSYLVFTPSYSLDGYQYRCAVTYNGITKYSEPATLTVYLNPPEIYGELHDAYAGEGTSVSLHVDEIQGDLLSYQWQVRKNSDSDWADSGAEGAKTNTLTLTPSSSMNGYQYRLVVSNDEGTAFSNTATLHVSPKPKITSQPASVTVGNGFGATFTVDVDGYDRENNDWTYPHFSFQWQVRKDSSSNWCNSSVASAKDDTLYFTGSSALDGYQYRCLVTKTEEFNNISTTAISSAATLTILPKPTFTKQPKSEDVWEGDKVSFSVGVSDSSLSYQWQVRKNNYGNDDYTEWTNSGIASAKTANLNFTANMSHNANEYRCVIKSGTVVVAFSNVAQLNVKEMEIPWFDESIEDVYVGEGETTSIHASVYGASIYGDRISYQWQVRKNSSCDWADSGAAGAKTDTLILTPSHSMSDYQYRCIAKNLKGITESNAATLHVSPKPKITSQPASVTVANGVNAEFKVHVEGYIWEENNWSNPSFSFQWQVRKNNSTDWSNSGASGNRSDKLSVTGSNSLNGYQYRCVVTRTEEVYGITDITTTTISSVATLTVVDLPKPSFTKQPVSASVWEGDIVTFSTGVSESSFSYQWQVRKNNSDWVNSGITSAKTANLSFTVNLSHDNNEYRCAILSGTTVVAYSNVAQLDVKEMQSPNQVYFDAFEGYVKEDQSVSFHAPFYGGGISYQWQVRRDANSNWLNSGAIGAKTDTLTLTANYSLNKYEYRCVAKNLKGSAESSILTLHVSPKPKITSQPASVTVANGVCADFSVHVDGYDRDYNYDWNEICFSFQWQVRRDSNSNWSNSSITSAKGDTLTITGNNTLNGYQYRCVVTRTEWIGWSSDYGDIYITTTNISSVATLTVVDIPKPTFTKQPVSQAIYEGDKASFIVGVTDGSFSYQWQVRKNSSASWVNSGIASAKTANLNFAAGMNHQNNEYRCVILSGSAVVAYSDVASLYVYEMESPYDDSGDGIYDRFVGEGETASFHAQFSGGGISYQWQVRKNSSADWSNSGASGAKTDTLTLTPSLSLNGYQYRVIAKNLKGTATSSAASLHVFPKPKITSQPKSISITEGMTAQFSVAVEGYDREDNSIWDDVYFSFQWQVRKNSSAAWSNSGIASAKTDTLSVSPSLSLNGYQYRCVVTRTEEVYDDYGWRDITTTTESSAATLTVFHKPEITAQPKSITVNEDAATSFSVTASGTGLSYQWQVRKNSSSNWANSGAEGNTTRTLNLTASASLAGYQYRCQVKSSEGGIAYSSTATLNIVLKPRIVTQPASTSVYAQETAWFAVEVTGTNPTYQWQVRKDANSSWLNSGAVGSKTDALSVTASMALNGYQYRCVIKNSAGTVVSAAAILTVKNIAISGWSQPNVKWTLDGGKLSVFLAEGGQRPFTGWSDYKDYIYTAAVGEGMIEMSGFSDCKNLRSVSLPSTIQIINAGAFSNCSSLTSINLPASLQEIGSSAFSGCTALTSLSIPANVTYLGNGAFRGCSNLSSINIPAGVTVIENNLFSGCQTLSSITIPAGVTAIGGWAFQDCESLASINIPSGVKEIGQSAFNNCGSLTSVSIPLGVTEIADRVFSGCYNLSSVTLPPSITSIGNWAFYNVALASIKIPSRTVSVGDYAFGYCNNLQSVSIPKSLTRIGNRAFAGCNLKTVRYQGNSTEYAKITIEDGNGILRNTNVLYNTY